MNAKLKQARRNVERREWFTYINVPKGVTLHIERSLLATIGKLTGGEESAGPELLNHYLASRENYGEQIADPAYMERFIGRDRLPVYFSTIDGKVYASGKMMMPF